MPQSILDYIANIRSEIERTMRLIKKCKVQMLLNACAVQ